MIMPRQAQTKSGGGKAHEHTEEEAQNQPDEEGPAYVVALPKSIHIHLLHGEHGQKSY